MSTDSDRRSAYRSPSTESNHVHRSSNDSSPWRLALSGALWSVAFTFPVAAITAMLFRFPVPFAGYVSGIEAVVPAMIAVVFYGVVLGGLILLGFLGAIGGFIAGIVISDNQRRCKLATGAWSLLVSTTGVFILAVLDKIIGPW